MRWKSFNEWKTLTIAYLSQLELEGNCETSRDILLRRLEWLKRRDLGRFLVSLRDFLRYCGGDMNILPTPEEIEEWFGEGELDE